MFTPAIITQSYNVLAVVAAVVLVELLVRGAAGIGMWTMNMQAQRKPPLYLQRRPISSIELTYAGV